MKKLLIRLLFKLLKLETDIFISKKDKLELYETLNRLSNSEPFRKYLIGREISIYEQLRSGVDMENYHILRGRLLEIVSFRGKINEVASQKQKLEQKRAEETPIA